MKLSRYKKSMTEKQETQKLNKELNDLIAKTLKEYEKWFEYWITYVANDYESTKKEKIEVACERLRIVLINVIQETIKSYAKN